MCYLKDSNTLRQELEPRLFENSGATNPTATLRHILINLNPQLHPCGQVSSHTSSYAVPIWYHRLHHGIDMLYYL